MAREVRVAILGDARDFQRAVRDVQGGATKMDRALGGARKAAVALGGAYAATEVVRFGADLVEAAEESQKVTRQTAAVIKSMGNASKVSAKQVEDLASALSLKSGVDDELIQSGQNILLTFGKIRNEVGKGNDIFDQASKITLDLSVALGKDMTSAATMVGKALNDPIAGLTSLTRAGVQFTDQQKEQIRQLVAVGDSLGAQKIIMAELDRQFSGSAEAQATATDKLRVAWDNIKEQLGTELLPVVEKVSMWLAENLPTAIDRTTVKFRELRDWVENNRAAAAGLAVAFGIAGLAILATAHPILAFAAGVAAATIATNWLIDRFNVLPKASKAIQWVVDHAIVPLIRALERAVGLARELKEALSLPGIKTFGGGGGSGGSAADFLKNQKVPSKAQGGWVPGGLGQPRLILAHGGERLLTHGQQMRGGSSGGGDTIVIQVGDREIARLYADGKVRAERRGVSAA